MHFLYILDPMCGWCYGFQPELDAFLGNYPDAKVEWIMGGLASDNAEPMDDALKQTISSYWHQIEKKTQVSFNHDFWMLNTAYRSTYPACRAVIAAEKLLPNSSQQMVKAIQSAYYQQAKNPSLINILVDCAVELGLDPAEFLNAIKSEDTEQQLQQHLNVARHLQVSGFPAMFYIDKENRAYPLTFGFCETANLEQRFNQIKLGSSQ